MALLFGTGARAAGPELVFNGGFESGDFVGWATGTNTPPTLGLSDQGPRHGQYAAYLGSPIPYDTISQWFSTVPGERYRVSFWLDSTGTSGTGAGFLASFGNTAFFRLSNADPDIAFKAFSFYVTANATIMTLDFAGYSGAGVYTLDDISLTAAPVPELPAWALLCAGVGVIGVRAWRRPG